MTVTVKEIAYHFVAHVATKSKSVARNDMVVIVVSIRARHSLALLDQRGCITAKTLNRLAIQN
jgi:hypothetical protein